VRAATVVNAAGAWADEVAALAGAAAISITPRRRTAYTFDPPAGLDCRLWPAVIALDESWHIKPDAGLLLGSPANADDTHPHDVVPEELDVALGIHRIEVATTLRIRRPRATWAGLRAFVADGESVLGFDPLAERFFWAAALGGYGIQSAPAVGALAAALLLRAPVPAVIEAANVPLAALAPRGGRPLQRSSGRSRSAAVDGEGGALKARPGEPLDALREFRLNDRFRALRRQPSSAIRSL
jgi:D-arginine dehydrogenase